VRCGGPSQGGELEFVDPRWAARSSNISHHVVSPVPGLLTVFPGWLEHWVRPVVGTDDRVCIAFNVGLSNG
jgi:hypothetical protein